MKNVLFMLWALVILAALYSGVVRAEAVWQADVEHGNAKIFLHTDACDLPAVANLKNRATWVEGKKVFQGCWGFDRNFGIIRMYFDDKSVVALPLELFEKVTET